MSAAHNKKTSLPGKPEQETAVNSEPLTGKPSVNEGQRLLLAVPGSHAEVGVSVGANRQSVWQWRSGKKLPGEKFRATLEKIHGIPSASWDQVPSHRAATTTQELTADAPSLPRRPEVSPDKYEALIERAQWILDSKETKPSDKLRAIAEIRQQQAQRNREQRLSKKVVSDKEIARSATWAQLKEAIGNALKPYPDALAAVVDAIKKLDI